MDSRGVAGFNLRDFSTDVSDAYEAYDAYQTSVEKPKIIARKNIFKEIARGVGSMPVMKSVREGFVTNNNTPICNPRYPGDHSCDSSYRAPNTPTGLSATLAKLPSNGATINNRLSLRVS